MTKLSKSTRPRGSCLYTMHQMLQKPPFQVQRMLGPFAGRFDFYSDLDHAILAASHHELPITSEASTVGLVFEAGKGSLYFPCHRIIHNHLSTATSKCMAVWLELKSLMQRLYLLQIVFNQTTMTGESMQSYRWVGVRLA